MLACVTLYFYRLFDVEVLQYWLTAALLFQFKESPFLSWLPVKQGVYLPYAWFSEKFRAHTWSRTKVLATCICRVMYWTLWAVKRLRQAWFGRIRFSRPVWRIPWRLAYGADYFLYGSHRMMLTLDDLVQVAWIDTHVDCICHLEWKLPSNWTIRLWLWGHWASFRGVCR